MKSNFKITLIAIILFLIPSVQAPTGMCRATELQYNACIGQYGAPQQNLTMNVGNFTQVCIGNICMTSWGGTSSSDFWNVNGVYLTINTSAAGTGNLNISGLFLNEVNILDFFNSTTDIWAAISNNTWNMWVDEGAWLTPNPDYAINVNATSFNSSTTSQFGNLQIIKEGRKTIIYAGK